MTLPSGEQFVLERDGVRAVVTEVGATLRQLSAGEQELVWGFGDQEMCTGSRGQLLAPWPNRLDEGHYRFGAHDAQVPLDEPARNCAIHGLARFVAWRLVDHTAEHVQLAHALYPTPAYPFALALEVTYSLGGDGIDVTTRATNRGDESLPFGLGFHPYLDPGPAGIESAVLEVPATRRIPLDARGLPCGPATPIGPLDAVAVAVASGGGRSPIGPAVLDECVTGLEAGSDGRWRAVLRPGPTVRAERPAPIEVWADASLAYCEIFTADTLPGRARRRAVAVEPMTCPPNALRSGEGLVVLAPGESFTGSFGIRSLGPRGGA